jgi:hypothetical protein
MDDDDSTNDPAFEWASALGFYALLVWVGCSDDAFNRRAFGEAPMGVPVGTFVPALITVVYLPLSWAVRHLARIILQMKDDGKAVTRIGFFVYLTQVSKTHPRLRHSVAWSAFAIVYLLILLIAWIAFTDSRGV